MGKALALEGASDAIQVRWGGPVGHHWVYSRMAVTSGSNVNFLRIAIMLSRRRGSIGSSAPVINRANGNHIISSGTSTGAAAALVAAAERPDAVVPWFRVVDDLTWLAGRWQRWWRQCCSL